MTPKEYAEMLSAAGDPFWSRQKEESAEARLATIVANFVAVNKMPPEAVEALDGLFDRLGAPPELRPFWNDRIAQGKRLAKERG